MLFFTAQRSCAHCGLKGLVGSSYRFVDDYVATIFPVIHYWNLESGNYFFVDRNSLRGQRSRSSIVLHRGRYESPLSDPYQVHVKAPFLVYRSELGVTQVYFV